MASPPFPCSDATGELAITSIEKFLSLSYPVDQRESPSPTPLHFPCRLIFLPLELSCDLEACEWLTCSAMYLFSSYNIFSGVPSKVRSESSML